jgi:hypothetical protein
MSDFPDSPSALQTRDDGRPLRTVDAKAFRLPFYEANVRVPDSPASYNENLLVVQLFGSGSNDTTADLSCRKVGAKQIAGVHFIA